MTTPPPVTRRPEDFPYLPDPCRRCKRQVQGQTSYTERQRNIRPRLGVPVYGGNGMCESCRRRARSLDTDRDGNWIDTPVHWPEILFGPLPQFDGAACAGAPDPDAFHELNVGGHVPPAAQMAAHRYCARCPVIAACGADADEWSARGLWGGVWRTGRGSGYRRRDLIESAPVPAAAAVPNPAAAASPTTTHPKGHHLMTADAKTAAQRLTFLTGLVSLAAAEKDAQRTATADLMEPGEAHPVRSPINGEFMARVRMSNPKATTVATITDYVALTEWIGREYPDRVSVTPKVSDRTADVLAVLAEHAPHLVTLETEYPKWATEEIVKLSAKAGAPVGPGGETDVPGVTVETREGVPSVSVAEKAPEFDALIVELAQSGRLSLDGSLRELSAAPEGPVVVDAETDAA